MPSTTCLFGRMVHDGKRRRQSGLGCSWTGRLPASLPHAGFDQADDALVGEIARRGKHDVGRLVVRVVIPAMPSRGMDSIVSSVPSTSRPSG